ncbi:T9SS type A sorting domain-containing protein [Pontibacter sp. G13]|uniref:T9SS type A sorting domain-containing protein n=1 Tax=Pontibacter sp. G13 TaxID=3074898 RepID=UPI00288B547A|nr:T9SS type A sorting domain-containing protein [Pontibacter sp. G13]WNJ19833.1 T9SS type A sorting domain-containing protein [Pontibacter sp. G13]
MKFLLRFCMFWLILPMGSLMAQSQFRTLTVPLEVPPSPEAVQQIAQSEMETITRRPAEVSLTHMRRSPGGWHFRYDHIHLGFPIHEAGIKVNIRQDGQGGNTLSYTPSQLSGSLPTRWASVPPLESQLASTYSACEFHWDTCWVETAAALQLAYRAELTACDFSDRREILLDASTGQTLQDRSLGVHHHEAAMGDTSGRGLAFVPDPITQGQTTYGAMFTDNSDLHTATLGSLMDTVILRDLTYDNGEFLLQGPYVEIQDIASFSYPIATSTDGTFYFQRDQSGFEDVMCYYHIDTFQRYVQHLGFTDMGNEPIQIDPHGRADFDNSTFFPNGSASYILFGDGGVDDAEDADVIIHEYGHALSNAVSPSTNSGKERQGLDEGFGDYIAAGYSYDLDTYRWEDIYTWDGHNEFWSGRSANDPGTYPPSGNSIYDFGTLWASAMMDVRLDIGGPAADAIMFEAMYSLFNNMTLEDAANLLLDADTALFSGVHSQAILSSFCSRNILNHPNCISVSNGPDVANFSWEAFPNPAKDRVRLRWKGVIQGVQLRIRIYNPLGQTLYQDQWALSANPRGIEIPLNMAPGMYMLEVSTDSERLGSRTLHILPY